MVLVEGHGSIDGLYFSKERMVDGILGSDSILGYVGEYFHEQIDQILLIFELIKKAGQVDHYHRYSSKRRGIP
jgi:hypothetical protein